MSAHCDCGCDCGCDACARAWAERMVDGARNAPEPWRTMYRMAIGMRLSRFDRAPALTPRPEEPGELVTIPVRR